MEANGFKTIHQNGVVVEVDQRARLDFALTIGSNTETITVEGSAPLLNTSDASVSTVIGNRFVENLPLNGRSFSSLIDLTPGVVLTPTNFYEQGQFSVNGQRPDANYFLVDGVSANLGTAGGGGTFGPGRGRPASGNQRIWRDQQPGVARCAGRVPDSDFHLCAGIRAYSRRSNIGGHQVRHEHVSRHRVRVLPQRQAGCQRLVRQRATVWRGPNCGRTISAACWAGRSKKDKLFFFGSYEGLRVRQPHVANTYVPSLASRQNAPAAVQPLLNAFPLPNGPDLGNGTAAFSASYSDPSTLNSSGIRIDYLPSQRVTIFGRYSDAPSSLDSAWRRRLRHYSNVQDIKYRTQTLTLGSNQALTPRLTNEFRFNYSRSRADGFYDARQFRGRSASSGLSALSIVRFSAERHFLFFGDLVRTGCEFLDGQVGRQPAATDQRDGQRFPHRRRTPDEVRAGLSPSQRRTPDSRPITVQYVFGSLANVLANTVPRGIRQSRGPPMCN